jgi:hypothetical protein
MINPATTSLEASQEPDERSELEEAAGLLGVGPDADAQTVEAAYWRLAKEIALRRRSDAFAGDKLDQINWAYQTLSNAILEHRRILAARRGPPRWRRVALAATTAVLFAAGLLAANAYQEDIRGLSSTSADRAQYGWEEMIAWLQSFGPPTPTPTPPAPPPGQ